MFNRDENIMKGDNYIDGTNVIVSDNFMRKYEEYVKKGYHTVNTYSAGLDDINDIFEGTICDDFILTDYLNKN